MIAPVKPEGDPSSDPDVEAEVEAEAESEAEPEALAEESVAESLLFLSEQDDIDTAKQSIKDARIKENFFIVVIIWLLYLYFTYY